MAVLLLYTIVLYYAPVKVASMLILFVSFTHLFWLLGVLVDLYRLHGSLSYLLIALISLCCVMFAVSDSEVVDCGHEHIIRLSLVHIDRRECTGSRRLPTVPNLLMMMMMMIIIIGAHHSFV